MNCPTCTSPLMLEKLGNNFEENGSYLFFAVMKCHDCGMLWFQKLGRDGDLQKSFFAMKVIEK